MSNKVQAKGVAERKKQNGPRNDELTNKEVPQSHAKHDEVSSKNQSMGSSDDQRQPTEVCLIPLVCTHFPWGSCHTVVRSRQSREMHVRC